MTMRIRRAAESFKELRPRPIVDSFWALHTSSSCGQQRLEPPLSLSHLLKVGRSLTATHTRSEQTVEGSAGAVRLLEPRDLPSFIPHVSPTPAFLQTGVLAAGAVVTAWAERVESVTPAYLSGLVFSGATTGGLTVETSAVHAEQ